eukprot:TRINITY_DN17875_c0_g1_i1.p1 TRINITY_DN17875_c0_g1~~TRINITY_DN17875_c0_g1_i1.p1  ORF type:complete len:273 (-),score=71.79 TRINITY_DN17875_c0_g1_i1:183-917(-)
MHSETTIEGSKPRWHIPMKQKVPRENLETLGNGFSAFFSGEAAEPRKTISGAYKKHYSPSSGKEIVWKPSCKLVDPASHADVKAGKKFLEGPKTISEDDLRHPGRKHVPEPEHAVVGPPPMPRRRRVVGDDGKLVGHRTSSVLTLDSAMSRKSHVEDTRNGIGEGKPGDKAYTAAEYSSDFFSKKSVGSIGQKEGDSLRHHGGMEWKEVPDKRIPFSVREKQREVEEMKDSVKLLDSWKPSSRQ